MMTAMGLPPKYGKTPSSWLNVEGSITSGYTLTLRGLPSHRRSASDSLALLKESHYHHLMNVAAAANHHHHHQTINNPSRTTNNGGDDGDDDDHYNKKKKNKSSSSSLTLDDKKINPKSSHVVDHDERMIMSGSSTSNSSASIKISIQPSEMMKNINNIDLNQYKWGRKFDPNMDPKKIKRILANRLSAQKSRLKKLEYKADLEKAVDALQEEVSMLSPQVAHYDRQRFVLRMENAAMKQKIAHLMNDKLLKEAQYRALKEETEKLKQIYMLQQQQQQSINVQKEQEEDHHNEQSYNVNQINLDFLNCLM